MHNGFLNVEGDKMSKSLGNFVTINDLLLNYPGGALRLAMLLTHYRQPISWSLSKTQDAWEEIRDWTTAIYGSRAEHDMHLRIATKNAPKPYPSILEALKDDLNSSEAITALRDLSKKRDDSESYSKLIETGEFLGLFEAKTIGAYTRGVSGSNLGPDRTFDLYETVEALRIAILNKQTGKQVELEKQIADKGIGTDISYDGNVTFQPLASPNPFEGGAIQRLINARLAAREAKDFKESDRIRDALLAQGIVLKDNKDGTTSWEVKR
jgi:cysteinyl-tRNA synthetase